MAPSKITGSSSLRSARGLFMIAAVFTLAGGFLDAHSFMTRGHVFANAQTGNIVLFAVAASGRDWSGAFRTVPPILAYASGIALGQMLPVRAVKRTFRATLLCQTLELAMLLFIFLAGQRIPNTLAVPIISFCSALQNASFSQIYTFTFNSTMTTGNLRTAIIALFKNLRGIEPRASRNQAIVAAAATAIFCLGAVLGAVSSRRLSRNAIGIAVFFVIAGILVTLRERSRLKNLTEG